MRLNRALSLAAAAAVFALSTSARAGDLRDPVVLPEDGALLNRCHLQVRWEPFHALRSAYTLEIVEDNGTSNPFNGGFPVTRIVVNRDEPRTTVKEGVEFGRSYAWRVSALVGGAPHDPIPGVQLRRRTTPIRRFATVSISPMVHPMDLIIPPGAEEVSPGVVLFETRRSAPGNELILGVDETGRLVFQFEGFDGREFSDMSRLDSGRLLYIKRFDVQQNWDGGMRPVCRIATVETLDGKQIWEAPRDKCAPPVFPFALEGAHHETFAMPNGNFLVLEYDNRLIPYPGAVNDFWQGDVIIEYDRHTKQRIKTWSTFDEICLDDYLPSQGPGGDFNHCNAAIYNEADDCYYVSARRQSAILRIERETLDLVYRLGEDSFPCMDVPPGFGDNLFSQQHAPEMLPNGNILIFNNGNLTEPLNLPRQSTAVELELDLNANPPTATKVWEFELVLDDLVTPAFADFVGDADRLPDGHTITCDGRNGNILEADADGNLVWFLNIGPGWPGTPQNPGTFLYRVDKVPDLIIDTPSDTDGDWDVDLIDFGRMQLAFTDVGPTSLPFPARLSDHDQDGDVDGDDVDAFAFWMTGPGK